MTEDVRLSAMVICQNEAAHIEACLTAVSFCDEVVVIDSGSTDGTQDLVRSLGARLIERPFVGMNDQKDFGRSMAKGRWVLNVDADEVVPEPLARRVREIADTDTDPHAAYRFPFRNHFRSVWVRRAGYFPDHHVRLVRRDAARWDVKAGMHDKVIVDGTTGTLTEPIDHFSFDSIEQFLEKSGRYARAFAQTAYADGRRAGFGTIWVHTVARFVKAYVLKKGFLEGTTGLVISGLQAYEVFQKYCRLWELSRFGPPK